MIWLQAIDTALFRFVNQSLANPVFDWFMPILAGGPKVAGYAIFVPAVLALATLFLWNGGRRGRVFVVFVALAVLLGDPLVVNTLKKATVRPRPCLALADTRALIGCSDSGSFPSGHAANWFAATMVAFLFYRRSGRFMLPMSATVAFSRVYNGVHYPSDVVGGALLGAGYAAGLVWSADALWVWAGRRWFPLWWQKFPSLMFPAKREPEPPGPAEPGARNAELDRHWLRLGYGFIAVFLLARLGYLASGTITLSKDEAYQWLWSKHLSLSYYSKPPGIALIQWAGTALWGDTQLGVRFFAPTFAALLSVVILRFLTRTMGARPGFLLLLIVTAVPLMDLGTILMTIDPPLVLCWTLALVAGWSAVQSSGTTRDWLFVGASMGLGFLSKYSAVYQILCWALFFALWPPARAHLRKPGPYLALLVFALATLPVILWNAQNHWITVQHVAGNAGLDSRWQPTLRYLWDFLLVEGALLNPVFFVGALWALVAFWPRRREHPLWLYFWCMGAPVFLGHLVYSLHSRILPNWIAPAVLPMFCLMVAYWDDRWRAGARAVKGWLVGGVAFGLVVMVLMHESNLIGKIVGQPLPAEVDPLRRVRAWKETAAFVEAARLKLQQEGRPAFIIADHYGMTGLFSFYLPEARAALQSEPLVYSQIAETPDNQFFFWPEYRFRDYRAGQNAIYITELDPYPLEKGWPWKWLTGQAVHYAQVPPPMMTPPLLREQFESVTDLGVHEIKLRGRVFRHVQLFECRHLRPPA